MFIVKTLAPSVSCKNVENFLNQMAEEGYSLDHISVGVQDEGPEWRMHVMLHVYVKKSDVVNKYYVVYYSGKPDYKLQRYQEAGMNFVTDVPIPDRNEFGGILIFTLPEGYEDKQCESNVE